jgi:hypothetical protein
VYIYLLFEYYCTPSNKNSLLPPPTNKQTNKLKKHQNAAQHNAAQHNTTQHNTTQHSTAQHTTAQHSTAQHNIEYNQITQIEFPPSLALF